MKNKVISTFPLKAVGLLSVTVENPDFSQSKPNEPVTIGGKNYIFHNIVMGRGIQKLDTFTVEYTEDNLLEKQVVF
ncbi:hypothetical protein GGG87_01225 [Streptococcus sp. zg-86]|uniref:Uncharacterized protein n=1 Tax=Streptococcus zhangguiae TaxID=2664091 RepID=A0A6I4RFQ1_9STRE|nr:MULTISPECIES: hypothetical protein [unclassified Streptococcus]MTB63631.1 hypothetical protein [Streptococcus sp. zg-86]MTB89720.1 hypothetical protein [Streptococcus sp. zg-36]MWV55391.1 hypothetical protein [Streptococcus sp. zg-70]QTH47588.1 hypothetical protein J5M87_08610 [Streptococcus sp. zg-86]